MFIHVGNYDSFEQINKMQEMMTKVSASSKEIDRSRSMVKSTSSDKKSDFDRIMEEAKLNLNR